MDFATVRYKAVCDFPYMASALWGLVPVATPNLQAMSNGPIACDKYWRVYYDPEFMDKTPLDVLVGCLMHEVNHLIRAHHERTADSITQVPESDDLSQWNVAGDLEINPGLLDAGLKLPEGIMTPARCGMPDGLLMEEYYDRLSSERDKQPQPDPDDDDDQPPGDPSGQPGSGQGQGKSKQPSQPKGGDGPPQPDDMPAPKGGIGRGNCGSCADAKPRRYDIPPTDQNTPAMDDFSQKYIQADVAEKIRTAPGSVPGDLQKWAGEILTRKRDWRKDLGVAIRSCYARVAGMVDYTFAKPSRRSPEGFIRPSLYAPAVEVGVVVDTSSSMKQPLLDYAIAEIPNIVAGLGQREVWVHYCNVHVSLSERTRKPRPAQLQRGGTDMREGIRVALEAKPKPNIVIVLTDCETPWPDERLNVPLIVAAVGRVDKGTLEEVPTWAKRVNIRE